MLALAQLSLTAIAANPPAAGTTAIEWLPNQGQVRLTFAGQLQVAESVLGPWLPLSNIVSPVLQDLAGDRKFYRAVDAAPSPAIFSTDAVIPLVIRGPLQTHFNLAFAGSPDGIFPPVRKKPYFDGTLSLGNATIPVSMRVRGNSSLQECPFPKLKFKVASTNRTGTAFADAREIKIGSHCAEGGRGNIGRLRDERAAYREALAYEVMGALEFTSPRLRRARITYQDTSPTNSGLDGGWVVTRMAVLYDDIEVVADRLGATPLSDAEVAALPVGALTEPLVTELQFLHCLLGNWDYALGLEGAGYQNTDLLRMPDRTLLPVAGDFDLASWVTGEVRPGYPRDYLPDLPSLDRQARYQLEQIKRRADKASFTAASNRFLRQRSTVEAWVESAELDAAGRTNALAHVTAFYQALATVQ